MVVDRSCYGDVLAASGVGTLHRIEGIMRKDDYNQIFEETFKKDARQLRLGWRCWFQHDNEPKHKAKVVTEWFNKAKINVLEWPSLYHRTLIPSKTCGETSKEYQRAGSDLQRSAKLNSV